VLETRTHIGTSAVHGVLTWCARFSEWYLKNRCHHFSRRQNRRSWYHDCLRLSSSNVDFFFDLLCPTYDFVYDESSGVATWRLHGRLNMDSAPPLRMHLLRDQRDRRCVDSIKFEFRECGVSTCVALRVDFFLFLTLRFVAAPPQPLDRGFRKSRGEKVHSRKPLTAQIGAGGGVRRGGGSREGGHGHAWRGQNGMGRAKNGKMSISTHT